MKKILFISLFLSIYFQCANAQWTAIDSSDSFNMFAVEFVSADTGFISGQTNGKIFKTVNGGLSWDSVQAPSSEQVYDIQFVSNNTGFACGGSGFSADRNILQGTADGGLTWNMLQQNPFPGDDEFIGMDFLNKLTGIVFSYAGLYSTQNGGANLTPINKPHSGLIITDVKLLADSSIVLLGWQLTGNTLTTEVYYSTNWGSSWNPAFIDTSIQVFLGARKPMEIAGNLGFIGCDKGWILRTNDAGRSWSKSKIEGDSINFYRVYFRSASVVCLLSFGKIYTSPDSGQNWQGALLNPYDMVIDMSMPSDTGYIIGYRTLYKTTDGGGFPQQLQPIEFSENAVFAYPNPASRQVTLRFKSFNSPRQLQLVDISGRNVLTMAIPANTSGAAIDLQKLPSGSYLFLLKTADSSVQSLKLEIVR